MTLSEEQLRDWVDQFANINQRVDELITLKIKDFKLFLLPCRYPSPLKVWVGANERSSMILRVVGYWVRESSQQPRLFKW